MALNSARQYLSAANFPGSVLDLIKLTANRALKSDSREVEAREVIVTLSQLTGLPVSILDSNERVDLASIRDYFTARVIGQDEAVAAIVDRIAMLKAGLNDPGKPIGVFLFAGLHRHRQDRARQDGRRVSVRLGRPHDPPRHERVPDAGDRRTRSSAARTSTR